MSAPLQEVTLKGGHARGDKTKNLNVVDVLTAQE
jgi:hypothetical protein